jgi:hypothetical protein
MSPAHVKQQMEHHNATTAVEQVLPYMLGMHSVYDGNKHWKGTTATRIGLAACTSHRLTNEVYMKPMCTCPDNMLLLLMVVVVMIG